MAISLIAKAGQGATLMKRDLKSAFRYIPVSPLDYRLLNFAWNAIFYVDKFLPVGLRTAFEYDFLFAFRLTRKQQYVQST